MALRGTIADMSFPELVQWLSVNSRTGRLILTQDQKRINIDFLNGELVFTASSSIGFYAWNLLFGKQSLRMPKRLVSPDQRHLPRNYFQSLYELGKSSEEIELALYRATEKIFIDALSMNSAKFEFTERAMEDAGNTYSLRPNEVLFKVITDIESEAHATGSQFEEFEPSDLTTALQLPQLQQLLEEGDSDINFEQLERLCDTNPIVAHQYSIAINNLSGRHFCRLIERFYRRRLNRPKMVRYFLVKTYHLRSNLFVRHFLVRLIRANDSNVLAEQTAFLGAIIDKNTLFHHLIAVLRRRPIGSLLQWFQVAYRIDSKLIARIHETISNSDNEVALKCFDILDGLPLSGPALVHSLYLYRSCSKVILKRLGHHIIKGIDDPHFVDHLQKAYEQRILSNIVEQFWKEKSDETRRLFQVFVDHPHNRLRATATHGACLAEYPEGFRSLLEMLSSNSPLMRASAVWCLGELRRGSKLILVLRKDQHPLVKKNVETAMKKLAMDSEMDVRGPS